ncbi:hypothetical protein D5086_031431 [Populus alba]|uniref:Uncharacterized protein n=1 Tax=Populus alba TaxID=43335 RepID=A0ACC4AIM4_POPAL
MAELGRSDVHGNDMIENLIAARKSLKLSLEKSKALGFSLEKAGPRLDEINRRLPSLEAAVRPILHGLEKSLSDPRNNLPGYLSVLKRLEEALRFLGDNCGLAIQWESQSDDERARLDGGLLNAALDKLEGEFRRLLTEHSVPLPMSSSPDLGEQAVIAPSLLPVSVIHKFASHSWEFAVKHLFEAEYKLCNDVFERFGLDVWMGCFSKIAAQTGISCISSIWEDCYRKLFGGAACIEIQNLTRDLIKRVIDGAAEIFWELLVQVELQRQIPPPPDGNVPILVSIITDYCNMLLGDNYKPILNQVLLIHRSWKHEKFQERILVSEVLNIVKAIELNLETWTKAYEDSILSNLFAMNNHYHLYKHLKGNKGWGSLRGFLV